MSNTEQPGFVLYNSYAEQFAMLSLEDRGALITALFEYQIESEIPSGLSPAAMMAFSFIKMDLDKNAQKYQERCEKNRSNGSKGGRPKNQTVLEETQKTERFSEKPKKPNINENKKEKENINTIITPPTPSKGETEERFADFWQAYPRKEAKEKARQAFKKLKADEDLLLKMLTAIEIQKQSDQWTKDDGRFIPLPATWLNGRRWEDEVKPPTSGNMFADYLVEMRGGIFT